MVFDPVRRRDIFFTVIFTDQQCDKIQWIKCVECNDKKKCKTSGKK